MNKNVTGGIVLLLGGAGLISLFGTTKGQQILTILKSETTAAAPSKTAAAAATETPKTAATINFPNLFGFAGEKGAENP